MRSLLFLAILVISSILFVGTAQAPVAKRGQMALTFCCSDGPLPTCPPKCSDPNVKLR